MAVLARTVEPRRLTTPPKLLKMPAAASATFRSIRLSTMSNGPIWLKIAPPKELASGRARFPAMTLLANRSVPLLKIAPAPAVMAVLLRIWLLVKVAWVKVMLPLL